MNYSDFDLTQIYKSANSETKGKSRPLTTQSIFRAMRVIAEQARQEGIIVGHDSLNAHDVRLSEENADLQSAIAEAVEPYKRDAERWENAARLLREAYSPDGHTAPHDCFATGPKTWDYIQDLIACPGCAAEDAYDAALAAKEGE